jgi:hypothetical protein
MRFKIGCMSIGFGRFLGIAREAGKDVAQLTSADAVKAHVARGERCDLYAIEMCLEHAAQEGWRVNVVGIQHGDELARALRKCLINRLSLPDIARGLYEAEAPVVERFHDPLEFRPVSASGEIIDDDALKARMVLIRDGSQSIRDDVGIVVMRDDDAATGQVERSRVRGIQIFGKRNLLAVSALPIAHFGSPAASRASK